MKNWFKKKEVEVPVCACECKVPVAQARLATLKANEEIRKSAQEKIWRDIESMSKYGLNYTYSRGMLSNEFIKTLKNCGYTVQFSTGTSSYRVSW